MNESQLKGIIERTGDLPTLPVIYHKVKELVDNPQTSASDLGRVIAQDQVLTTKLLRLVNSSFYGFPQRITTVNRAIAIIGFRALKAMVLATSILRVFSLEEDDGFQGEKFWQHSIGCAVGAKIIGKYVKYEEPDELFVAGLIHDIGKVVEYVAFGAELKEILKITEKEGIFIREAENRVLGADHAQIGSLFIRKWKLPPELVDPVTYHHNPQEAKEFPKEAAIIHFSDILIKALGLGWTGDYKVPPLDLVGWDNLGLGKEAIGPIMEEMEEGFWDGISILKE